MTKEIFNSHPVSVLKKEISKTNIKGYSKMKKAEVVELMMKNKSKFGHIKMATKAVKSAPKKKIIKKTPKKPSPSPKKKSPSPKKPSPKKSPSSKEPKIGDSIKIIGRGIAPYERKEPLIISDKGETISGVIILEIDYVEGDGYEFIGEVRPKHLEKTKTGWKVNSKFVTNRDTGFWVGSGK